MGKKVVLVKPQNIFGYSAYPPLGVLTVGTVLYNNDYNVVVIDAAVEREYKGRLLQECKDAILVGIGCCTSEVMSAIKIADFVKTNFNAPIVFGGWHPTLFPEQTCADRNVDFVVIGEGDYTLLKLVQELEGGGNFQELSGLAYKKDDAVFINKPIGYIDVEGLSPTEYDFVDIARYSTTKLTDYFSRSKKVWLPYQSSRGCVHRCAFCINVVTGNNTYRAKSAGKVVEEVRELIDRHRVTHLRIIDDSFFVDSRRVRAICEGFVKGNIKITWDAECRVDYFRNNYLNDDLLNLCTESGLVELTLGCESGSQNILNYMKKDIRVGQITHCVKQCHKHGIVARCSFMTGIPGETKYEMLLTARLINKLRNMAPEIAVGVATFRPYPKSEMCDDLLKKGVFEEPKSLREWTAKKYIKNYTERNFRQSWQTNGNLTSNMSFYYTLGILLANQQIRSRLLRKINTFFIWLGRKRTKNLCFGFPLDKFIYNIFYRTYFKYDTFIKNRRQND